MRKLLVSVSLCLLFLSGCSSMCGSEPVYEPMGKTGEPIDHDYK